MKTTFLHQDDFTVQGRVAVWLGTFTDELAADDYLNLDRGFERDFGFVIADQRTPELAVIPQPVSIRELVEGFLWSHDYADAIVAGADAAAIASASTMLVFTVWSSTHSASPSIRTLRCASSATSLSAPCPDFTRTA